MKKARLIYVFQNILQKKAGFDYIPDMYLSMVSLLRPWISLFPRVWRMSSTLSICPFHTCLVTVLTWLLLWVASLKAQERIHPKAGPIISGSTGKVEKTLMYVRYISVCFLSAKHQNILKSKKVCKSETPQI